MATPTLVLLVFFIGMASGAFVPPNETDNRRLSITGGTKLPTGDRIHLEDTEVKMTKKSTRGKDDARIKKLDKGRKHKAVFVDYPFVPRINSYDGLRASDYRDVKSRNGYRESEIFYIKLPATPYTYVPGLGYISQPPIFSTAGLQPRPTKYNHQNSFVNLPIDFVSNGKPTSVYQWSVEKKRPSTIVNELDKGPYLFNGRPSAVYLLDSQRGTASIPQPIQYANRLDDNAYYY